MPKSEDEIIEEAAELLLEDDSFYESQATELISAKTLKARHKAEIKESLKNEELQEEIEKGFELIRQDIIEVLQQEELNSFHQELTKIKLEAIDKPSEEMTNRIKETDGMVALQEIFGLSDDFLKKVYSLGYQYFQKKNYNDAISVFTVVIVLNPFVSDFWNAIALCYQAKEEWELAVDAFKMACTINDKSVAPRVSRAECCFYLNQVDEAKDELALASAIVEKNPALDKEWGAYINELKKVS